MSTNRYRLVLHSNFTLLAPRSPPLLVANYAANDPTLSESDVNTISQYLVSAALLVAAMMTAVQVPRGGGPRGDDFFFCTRLFEQAQGEREAMCATALFPPQFETLSSGRALDTCMHACT